MSQTVIQILTTLALVLGVAAGESIAGKAFGTLKKAWYYVAEIVLFVSAIVVVFNTLVLVEIEGATLILLYFAVGGTAILFVRALLSGFGFIASHIQEKLVRHLDEKDYIIGLKKALERRGFETEETKRIAKEVGFSKKKVNELFSYFKITKK